MKSTKEVSHIHCLILLFFWRSLYWLCSLFLIFCCFLWSFFLFFFFGGLYSGEGAYFWNLETELEKWCTLIRVRERRCFWIRWQWWVGRWLQWDIQLTRTNQRCFWHLLGSCRGVNQGWSWWLIRGGWLHHRRRRWVWDRTRKVWGWVSSKERLLKLWFSFPWCRLWSPWWFKSDPCWSWWRCWGRGRS